MKRSLRSITPTLILVIAALLIHNLLSKKSDLNIGSSAYGSRSANRDLVWFAMAIIVGSTWILTHHFFKWVRKNHRSAFPEQLGIIACIIITVLLFAIGISLGNHITNPEIRSLGSSANENMMWFPALLFSLGIWAGYLSGYAKLRVD